MERNDYIDNLRWLMILLLFPFHAAQIWSGGEYSGFYIWSHTNTVLYVFSTVVYPWYMTFLFAIAGISCKYALQKRTNRQFVTERTKKLLVPFFFGQLVLVPVMTYIAEIFFNGYTGNYLQQYGLFFTKETDLTGYRGGFTPGHLWFLLYLFVISLAALFIILLQKKCLPKFQVCNVPYFFLVFLFIPEWLCQYVLNIGGKSLGQFMILYLFGYYILSEENILKKIKQYWFLNLALCIISGGLYTYLYCFENLRNIWMTGLYIFFGWMGIMTLLGIGQSKLNFHNRLSDYLSRASFPVYILHMPILVVVGFFVLKLPFCVAGQFSLIVLISSISTFLIYEIANKITVLRFFLGIKNLKGGDINLETEKKRKWGQGIKIRKKILFIVSILVILLLLLCTIKIVQIQLYSIWSESAIKFPNQYDTVLMRQDGWGEATEPLDQKDLIRLYFILGSTRKYQPEKHQKYLPDGKILRDPYIVFYDGEQYSNDAACLICWKYKNNTLIVYENADDEGKANRYYIDEKHAKLLYDLFKKHIII